MINDTTDVHLIRQTIQAYFDGMFNSDVDTLKKAFHTSANITGYYNGNLVNVPLREWLEMVASTPSPAKNGEK